MTSYSIKSATADHTARAIDSLVLAFSADPAARWFYPDPHQYLMNFPSFVRAFAGKAFAHNSAHQIDEFSGTALWLPPGVHPDENALSELLQRTIAKENLHNVFAFLEQMGGYHPSDAHWYLPLIGVDPTKQGNGYGSALLHHALQRCDAEGKLAYLESSSEKSVPLYQRHGFELLGKIQVSASPPLFPMLRRPR